MAATALKAAEDKRFFHWELEFLEVFFGPSDASAQEIVSKKNAGFDAVVGNPPYRDLKELDRVTVELLFVLFDSTRNRANIYSAFLEQAIALARENGEIGLTVPNSWFTQSSYSDLKNMVMSQTHFHHFVRVPETAFPEQKVETTIIASRKCQPSADAETQYFRYRDSMTIQSIESANAPFFGVKKQSQIAIERQAVD